MKIKQYREDGSFIEMEANIVISEKEKNEIRIKQLKKNLFDTDYQVLKWKEGELTDYEFEPMRLQRKAWREEIRELEKQI